MSLCNNYLDLHFLLILGIRKEVTIDSIMNS
jgi:hypothetical protein